uniref:Uncharacterized protein n=1 Tax=Anopheles atroparvus TaxID=41427 RepID=A0AAG5DBR8_ANOAO
RTLKACVGNATVSRKCDFECDQLRKIETAERRRSTEAAGFSPDTVYAQYNMVYFSPRGMQEPCSPPGMPLAAKSPTMEGAVRADMTPQPDAEA